MILLDVPSLLLPVVEYLAVHLLLAVQLLPQCNDTQATVVDEQGFQTYPFSMYQLLFGWFRIYFVSIISGVFCDQSDDLAESIWVYWRSLRP